MELIGTIIKTWFEPKESALLKFTVELSTKEVIELVDKGSFNELMNKYLLKVDGMDYIDLGTDGKQCLLSKDEDGYHFVSFIDT